MKLFIQIVTILAVSLLVGFSQAQPLDDCTEEVKIYHGVHVYETRKVPKSTPECKRRRELAEKVFGFKPLIPNEKKDKPAFNISNPKDKDAELIKPTETPNLKGEHSEFKNTQKKREKALLPKSEENGGK